MMPWRQQRSRLAGRDGCVGSSGWPPAMAAADAKSCDGSSGWPPAMAAAGGREERAATREEGIHP